MVVPSVAVTVDFHGTVLDGAVSLAALMFYHQSDLSTLPLVQAFYNAFAEEPSFAPYAAAFTKASMPEVATELGYSPLMPSIEHDDRRRAMTCSRFPFHPSLVLLTDEAGELVTIAGLRRRDRVVVREVELVRKVMEQTARDAETERQRKQQEADAQRDLREQRMAGTEGKKRAANAASPSTARRRKAKRAITEEKALRRSWEREESAEQEEEEADEEEEGQEDEVVSNAAAASHVPVEKLAPSNPTVSRPPSPSVADSGSSAVVPPAARVSAPTTVRSASPAQPLPSAGKNIASTPVASVSGRSATEKRPINVPRISIKRFPQRLQQPPRPVAAPPQPAAAAQPITVDVTDAAVSTASTAAGEVSSGGQGAEPHPTAAEPTGGQLHKAGPARPKATVAARVEVKPQPHAAPADAPAERGREERQPSSVPRSDTSDLRRDESRESRPPTTPTWRTSFGRDHRRTENDSGRRDGDRERERERDAYRDYEGRRDRGSDVSSSHGSRRSSDSPERQSVRRRDERYYSQRGDDDRHQPRSEYHSSTGSSTRERDYSPRAREAIASPTSSSSALRTSPSSSVHSSGRRAGSWEREREEELSRDERRQNERELLLRRDRERREQREEEARREQLRQEATRHSV